VPALRVRDDDPSQLSHQFSRGRRAGGGSGKKGETGAEVPDSGQLRYLPPGERLLFAVIDGTRTRELDSARLTFPDNYNDDTIAIQTRSVVDSSGFVDREVSSRCSWHADS
jgi:hypothetical protein